MPPSKATQTVSPAGPANKLVQDDEKTPIVSQADKEYDQSHDEVFAAVLARALRIVELNASSGSSSKVSDLIFSTLFI